MSTLTALERLTPLFLRLKAQAKQFQAGPLCGAIQYGEHHGVGFLHVLRRGRLEINHRQRSPDLPAHLVIEEPTLLFYPRPCLHEFINPATPDNDFVCATVAFEGKEFHPVAQALPALLMVPLRHFGAGGKTLEMLFAEADAHGNTPSLLADKLFEVLLLQLLRWCLESNTAEVSEGLLAGLSHPAVSKALTALHAKPCEEWTVQSLAAVAGMSRSAFALAFKEAISETPMEYLARWRLAIAQQKLLQGRTQKVVATEVGYGTSAALSRAFSSRLGASPRKWLQQHQMPAKSGKSGSSS